MSDLKEYAKTYLESKGFTKLPSPSNQCNYIFEYSKGEWSGTYWATVNFPDCDDYNTSINVRTGYAGAHTGDEGYFIASYSGFFNDIDEFLQIMKLTRVDKQIERSLK